jgi:hypothetical protein
MRARYYNPDIKRFINLDVLLGSIDEGQSLNRYAYVNGNPISYVDPFGTCVESGEAGHIAFDAAGFWPGAGMYFDATNAIWYAAEGDWTNFGWSAVAAVPIAGDIFQASRLGIKYLSDVGAVNRVIERAKSAGKQLTKGAGNEVKILGKGSTGRTTANNLTEQLAMKEVKSNPLAGAKELTSVKMSDSRWLVNDGWVKMSKNVNGVEVHYVYNTKTGAFDDFKFK